MSWEEKRAYAHATLDTALREGGVDYEQFLDSLVRGDQELLDDLVTVVAGHQQKLSGRKKVRSDKGVILAFGSDDTLVSLLRDL